MDSITIAKKRYLQLVDNIILSKKLSHAYLIEIDNYESDFSYVIDFIKLILCQNEKKNSASLSCGKCNICEQVDNNSYVDLKIIEPDGASIRKKQVLDLQEEFKNKSFLDNKLIYVIKEADKLNDSSANTILKFLEEPEDDIVAILVTTNRYKIIETILSRCQVLSIKDSNYSFVSDPKVLDLIKFIINKNDLFINYQYIFSELLPDKVVAKEILLQVESAFISYLNYEANKNYECDSQIIKLLSKTESLNIIKWISIIEEEIVKLEYNVNYKLWLDSLFARLIGG